MKNIKSYDVFVERLMTIFNEKNADRADILTDWLSLNVSENHLQKLFNAVIENEQFFPVPATIKKHLDVIVGNTAEAAYLTAIRAVATVGMYNSCKFGNCKIAETIRRGWGSWSNFCTDSQKPEWKRKMFVDIYNNFEGTFSAYLKGTIEQQNGGLKNCRQITIGSNILKLKEQGYEKTIRNDL